MIAKPTRSLSPNHVKKEIFGTPAQPREKQIKYELEAIIKLAQNALRTMHKPDLLDSRSKGPRENVIQDLFNISEKAAHIAYNLGVLFIFR